MIRGVPAFLGAVMFVVFTSVNGQSPVSRAPERSTFNLGPDNLEDLQNSINLISGQVTFPIGLGILSGRGGLSASVALQYNSAGVDQVMKTSNKLAASGILGVGWSMDIPMITVDHKLTGTRHDDDYYLIEGGISSALICTSFSTNPREFKTKSFKNWRVLYYTDEDKWEITVENGYKHVYKAAQYLVKWDNWIGISAQNVNQSRMGFAWALAEVENTWGEKLSYQYTLEEEPVGINGINHTRTFRLSKVTDPVGQSAEFVYLSKNSSEYYDPFTKKAEPDAYQEKYETKYLSQVVFRSERNAILYSVNFEYVLKGEGEFMKRFLTKIQKTYPATAVSIPTKFEYFDSGAYLGYMKTVTNSFGARIEYFYTKTEIASSNQRLDVAAPNVEYGQPKLFTAGDYVVVFWRKLKSFAVDGGPQPVKAAVYHWDGQWNSENLWDIPAVTLSDYDKMNISLAEKHFITRFYQSQTNTLLVYGARKKTYAAGTTVVGAVGGWEKFDKQFLKNFDGDGNGTTSVFAEEDFVAFTRRFDRTFSVWTWKYETWEFNDIVVPEGQHEHFCTTGNNFVFVHNDAKGDQDVLHLYYLDGNKDWQESNVPESLSIRTDRATQKAQDSYWHAGNTCVVGLPQLSKEYVYTWDENYGNFSKIDLLGEYVDNTSVYVNYEGLVCVKPSGDRHDGTALRFDGMQWNKGTFNVYDDYVPLSFGSDYLMTPLYPDTQPKQAALAGMLEYDPNRNIWVTPLRAIGSVLENVKLSDRYGNAVQAGSEVVMVNDRIVNIITGEGETLPLETGDFLVGSSAIVSDPNYVVYAYSPLKSGDPTGIYIVYLENLKIKSYERLPGYVIESGKSNSGPSIFAARSGRFITLFKFLNGKSSGLQSPVVVSNVLWSDGNHQSEVVYDYTNGKINAMGLPLFNVVKTYSGSDGSDASVTGYTQYYYYNGMEEENLVDQPSISNKGKELLLIGNLYQTAVKDRFNGLVSYTINSFDLMPKLIKTRNSVNIDSVYVICQVAQTQMLDGVITVLENTFDAQTGFLKSRKQVNSKGLGSSEDLTTYYKYWWEVYDPTMQANVISPIVQSKSIATRSDGSLYQTSNAVKWHYDEINGTYYPTTNLSWRYTGSADFTAWQDSDEVPSDWEVVSRITSRDLNDGTVFEVQSTDGTRSSSIYDITHTRVTAMANFAASGQIAFSSFEDASTGNWTYDKGLVINTDSFNGGRCFKSNGSSVTLTKNLNKDRYEVSFWAKGGTPTLEVTSGVIQQSITEEELDGWMLTRVIFDIQISGGLVKIKVPANVVLDDARLKPVAAEMTTNVYNAEGNLIVKTNNNLFRSKYEYDGQYRLTNLRNNKGEIVKQFMYHYKDQE